jgi:glutaredoxin
MTASAPAKTPPRTAVLYRMVTDQHLCPWGLRSKDLLRRQGYIVEDHLLTTRQEIDVFKAAHGVATTPQTFIDGARIGGYDDLRRHFGKSVRDPKAKTYTPVLAVFAVTALMALAVSRVATGQALTPQTLQWFIAFSAPRLLDTRRASPHLPDLVLGRVRRYR